MNKLNLLVYAREYFKFNYLPLFAAVPNAHVDFLTDFPTVGMLNIRDLFYRELEKHDPTTSLNFDVDDVIQRCRLLRNIAPESARKMAGAMYCVMDNVLTRCDYDAVATQIVDDYITHVLALAAAARGIRYIGICSSYFAGYTQVSQFTNGTPVKGREVDAAEARRVTDAITRSNFRMDYTQPTTYGAVRHVKRVFRYYFKKLAFIILKIYRKDPLNFHYSVQKYIAQPKYFTGYPDHKFFQADWKEVVRRSIRRVVYIPLGVTPESTVDYWVPHPRFLNYEGAMVSIATDLAKDYLVVIKEHTHMIGCRDKKFYERLRALQGVVMVPPQANSNALLEEFRPTVVVGAGSVGIEAILRRLPVVTFSPSSYWYPASDATLVSADTNEEICEAVANAAASKVDPVEFVRQCLQTMIPFDYMHADSLEPTVLAQIRPFLCSP